jgi:transcriptional regulator with XRE-family HTH domain
MPKTDCVRLDPQKLVALAVRAELTRREVAAKAHVTHSTLTRAFSGVAIGIKSARVIARALGATVAGLMIADDPAVSLT